MEQLIILAIIVGASLIHGWWKKKQGEADEDSPWPGQPPWRTPPRPGQPAPPPPRPKPMDLEEELRRMLGGEEPKPPPVVTPPRMPPPPPLPRPVRTAPRPVVVSPSVIIPEPATGSAGALSTAAQAFLRGNQLESKVAAHMHRVPRHGTQPPAGPVHKQASPEVREAIGLLRTRKSQRAAIIASVVLGPPKAMEP